MLSEHISTPDILGDQPIFGIKQCQEHVIVKKYGKMIGVDIRRVQLLLGHSNLNTTQVYRQFRDHDLQEAIITFFS